MRVKILAIVVLLVVAGGTVAYSLGVFTPSAASASTYLTATAAVTNVSNDIAATGSVSPTQSWNLAFGSAPTTVAASSSSSSPSSSSSNSNANGSNGNGGGTSVTWPVGTVSVTVGAAVKKGQVLATASTSDLTTAIDDASRSASSAHYQLLIAQDNRDNAVTTAQIRNADIQLLQAESSDASAKATLASLKAERAYASLSAPADGVVTAVNVGPGQDAPSGTAITIAANTLEVTTSVVESDVPLVTVGQKATVTLSAVNQTVQGTVASIAPSGSASGNNGAVAFDVEVTLDSVPAGVRSGMSASVTITTASATNALAIPSRALSGTAGSYTVRILNADGSVTVQAVEVGLVTSSLAQITSGLNAGDRVITGTSTAQQSTTNTTFGFGGGGLGGGGINAGTFRGGTFRGGTNP